MTPNELSPGDRFMTQYGFEERIFKVIGNNNDVGYVVAYWGGFCGTTTRLTYKDLKDKGFILLPKRKWYQIF